MATAEIKERILRIGTRESLLAMTQTHHFVEILARQHPSLQTHISSMTTTGDQILNSPLHEIGSKALFTKELEYALINGNVDCIVHSFKDVPTQLPDNCEIGCVLEREDPRDSLVMRPEHVQNGITEIGQLPPGSVIGTSSVRRMAQIRRYFPHLVIKDIRGNVGTRLDKLLKPAFEDRNFDAIVLASAGLKRLNLQHHISSFLTPDLQQVSDKGLQPGSQVFYYAVGQGALAIEIRSDDEWVKSVLAPMMHEKTLFETAVEREIMRGLEGGCSIPIGVLSQWAEDGTLRVGAVVVDVDGSRCVETMHLSKVTTSEEAVLLGRTVTNDLISKGAQEILASIKKK